MATRDRYISWATFTQRSGLHISLSITPYGQVFYIAKAPNEDGLNRFEEAGFRPFPTKEQGTEHQRWIAKDNFSLPALRQAFPDQALPIESVEKSSVYFPRQAALNTAIHLGVNAQGEDVYRTFANYRTAHSPKNGDKHYLEMAAENAANMIDPRFMLAWDIESSGYDKNALNSLADGFVERIIKQKLQSKDLRNFAAVSSLGNASSATSPHYRQAAEAVEGAISRHISSKILQGYSADKVFEEACLIVQNQPVLAARSGQQIALQQYSTPATIATVAGTLLGDLPDGAKVLDPAVGTGMLLAALPPLTECYGMDIDADRKNAITRDITFKSADSLKKESYSNLPIMDGIIINPPFGALPQGGKDNSTGVTLRRQDYLMSMMALEKMADDGKAVLITGADGIYGDPTVKGGSKYFLNKLYDDYNVCGAIEIDGSRLYRKQDAAANVRMYFINGRGKSALEVPTKFEIIKTTDELWSWRNDVFSEHKFSLEEKRDASAYNEFQSHYVPRSIEGATIGTPLVPKNLEGAIIKALDNLEKREGMSVDDFVREHLKYPESTNLGKFFTAPQMDAIALGIGAARRKEGNLIGDQTGFGKGRIVAAMARYHLLKDNPEPKGTRNPLIFLSEKGKLFSDMWRDFENIESDHLFKPLILNASQAQVYNKAGEVVFKHDPKATKSFIASEGRELNGANIVFATYSQFQNKTTSFAKQSTVMRYLSEPGGAMLADEAHNLAGDQTNTFFYFSELTKIVDSVTFSSATSMKSSRSLAAFHCLFPASISFKSIVNFAQSGDASVMTTVSHKLAENGSYMRRETPLDGIEFQRATFRTQAKKDAVFSKVEATTSLLREIAAYAEGVRIHVGLLQKDMKKNAAEHNSAKGDMGISIPSFGSRLHVVNRQLTLMMKADIAIDETVEAIRSGKKPVLASELTMGAAMDELISSMEADEFGNYMFDKKPGAFEMFLNMLEKVSFATKMTGYGATETVDIRKNGAIIDTERGLTSTGVRYENIKDKIIAYKGHLDAISVTFLDDIHEALGDRGYSMYEVSGRKLRGSTNEDGSYTVRKSDLPTQTEGVNGFNNGEYDALYIVSGSGAAGLSAHASPDFSNQMQRVLILIQASQDINKLVQMLGRVNRLDQVCLPIFQFTSTGIPSEERENSACARKLQALQASTSANKESGLTSLIGSHDYTNRIGDQAVLAVLNYERNICDMLGLSLENLNASFEEGTIENGALVNKVTGRFSLLPPGPTTDVSLNELLKRTEEHDFLNQQLAYKLLDQEYSLRIQELEAAGVNPFKANNNDWKAVTLEERLFFAGEADSDNAFDAPAYLKHVQYEVEVSPMPLEQVMASVDKGADELVDYLATRGGKQDAYEAARDIAENKLRSRLLSGLTDPSHLEGVKDEDITNNQRSELRFKGIVDSCSYDELRRMVIGARGRDDMFKGKKANRDRLRAATELVRTLDVVKETLTNIVPGRLLRLREGDLNLPKEAIVTALNPPEAEEYYGHLGHWKVHHMTPGDEKISVSSLHSLVSKVRDSSGEIDISSFRASIKPTLIWSSTPEDEMTKEYRLFVNKFDALIEGTVLKERVLITGNVVGAISNFSEDVRFVIGSYTDEKGMSHISAILPPATKFEEVGTNMLCRLSAQNAENALLEVQGLELGNEIFQARGMSLQKMGYRIAAAKDGTGFTLECSGAASSVRNIMENSNIRGCLASDLNGDRHVMMAQIKEGSLGVIIPLLISDRGAIVCSNEQKKTIDAALDTDYSNKKQGMETV